MVGKPRQVDDKNSETKLLPIFQKVGFAIDPAFTDDCNRLGKFNDRVIVKLTRRKYPEQILKVKEDLGDLNMEDLNVFRGTKTYINQSLCPYYQILLSKAKRPQNIGSINFFF